MNTLVTTVCNDRFSKALTLLIWSIRRHNPSFDHPIKVYYRGDLSEQSQERILHAYDKVVFENVASEGYLRKIPHYLALEVFREFEPDNVVFIDSDIVCLGDLSALWELDHPLSACLDYDVRFPWFLNVPFPLSLVARVNTGVFALNKTYRNRETYEGIYELLDRFPDDFVKGAAWSDQGIINEYFRKDRKYIIPYYYNGRKNLFPNWRLRGGSRRALANVRLLHFGGAFKPFLGGLKTAPANSKHHKYSRVHEVYYDCWNDMVADLKVDWKLNED